MGNIFTFIEDMGHLAFDELGFGEVDSLIFSELAYLNYDRCADQPTPFRMTLEQLRATGFQQNRTGMEGSAGKRAQLFLAAAASPRYRNVGVDFFVRETDDDEQKQFAAVTFRLSPRLHYVAFRGTDGTITGWKENLNLSYMEDVPAQRAAHAYFEKLCNRMRSRWILGGHSKGGNLAVYAAISAQPKFQRDIAWVYDHDGPGFLDSVLARPGYAAMADRIRKTVPESAVVGLLLSDPTKIRVVKSTAHALVQHLPFTWLVEDAGFVTAEDTDGLSRFADRTIQRWIRDLSAEDRRVFADALYTLIQSTGANTVPELINGWKHNLPAIYARLMELPPDVRRAVLGTVNALALASGESALLSLSEQVMQSSEDILQSGNEFLHSDSVKQAGKQIRHSGKQILETGKQLWHSSKPLRNAGKELGGSLLNKLGKLLSHDGQ